MKPLIALAFPCLFPLSTRWTDISRICIVQTLTSSTLSTESWICLPQAKFFIGQREGRFPFFCSFLFSAILIEVVFCLVLCHLPYCYKSATKNFQSKKEESFNFMAAVTICSDFVESKKIKSLNISIVSPSICHEVMGPDAMIFAFWVLSFKPAFSLSSFTYVKKLFSSSLLSAIRVVSSA